MRIIFPCCLGLLSKYRVDSKPLDKMSSSESRNGKQSFKGLRA